MTLRCKPGDLAIVVYDIPECASNIGRVVMVRGPLQYNVLYKLQSWLIKPVRAAHWKVDYRGLIRSHRVFWSSNVEHPDAWMVPIRPDELDRIAERSQQDLDRFLARLKADADGLKQPVSTTTEG